MKYLRARSLLMPDLMLERYAAGALHEPWVNGLAVVPVLTIPGVAAKHITQAMVDEWIEELKKAGSAAFWWEINRLQTDPCRYLLETARGSLNGKGDSLRLSKTGDGYICVAAMCSDGFAASRLLLSSQAFLTCRAMFNCRASEFYATIPCRDMLCIFRTELEARDTLGAPIWMNPLACSILSLDVFVLTADGVAGTRKEEATACG